MQAILISIGTPLREYRMKQMKQMKQLLQGHLSGLVGIGAAAILFASGTMALADDLSGVGSAADEQLFFKPFETESIPPEERQRWPYSRHTFANWPEFTEFGWRAFPHHQIPPRSPSRKNSWTSTGHSNWASHSCVRSTQRKQLGSS